MARGVRAARSDYPAVIKAPFSGELAVALDGDDMTPELKAEMLQFERQEMERLLYVAITRARHTLVLAFDEKIFAKTNGEVNPKSQLHWLQGSSGGRNAPELAALPKRLSICAATQARQERDSETSAGARIPAFAPLEPNEKRDAAARASEFVHKRNPSELATQFRILSGVTVDFWNETDPELRPLVQETPATRYGLWWHSFFQRLSWQAEDLFLPNSPDPARSAR